MKTTKTFQIGTALWTNNKGEYFSPNPTTQISTARAVELCPRWADRILSRAWGNAVIIPVYQKQTGPEMGGI